MAITGLEVFDETIQKTNVLLNSIEQNLEWQGQRQHTYDVLRAVLHTLRDRLTIEESSDLSAQLPMLVRGIYFEGWNPSRVPVKFNKTGFLTAVKEKLPSDITIDTERIVVEVWRALRQFVVLGEAEDVLSVLPEDIASMFLQAE